MPRTLLHMCMDGRDTPPTSGAGYMELLEAKLAELGYGEVSSISGRYYAMDRDKRWERVQKAYDVMCRGPGECETVAPGGVKAVIEGMYAAEKKDEFIDPTGLVADGGTRALPRSSRPPPTVVSHGRAPVTAARSSAHRARHRANKRPPPPPPPPFATGIADGDIFVCFNFRSDRAREMFECLSVKPLVERALRPGRGHRPICLPGPSGGPGRSYAPRSKA